MVVALYLVGLACTGYMTGLIWFVQVVHYPLFAQTGTTTFGHYETEHERLTTRVVAGPMTVEGIVALMLVFARPWWMPFSAALGGVALAAVIWASTFLLQVPQHAVLEKGFDLRAHRKLVATNWIRAFAWTARLLVLLVPMQPVLQQSANT